MLFDAMAGPRQGCYGQNGRFVRRNSQSQTRCSANIGGHPWRRL